ncbi:hypothetical protein BM1_05625 [Bipolaris maydis]|nr:hypothetical protein BM1_05625 [Bipolaris maydis]
MAKKTKVAKAAKDVHPRLKTSLYTSPFVTLHFGPTHQKYYLPEVLLQKLGNIPSRDHWTGEIHLVDVDASIGHVLIHFLHTGVYQTLNDEDVEGADYPHKTLARNEFQTALLALEAAKKYSVHGLQEVAQVELERRGREIGLHDAVHAIREESIAGASDENAWLRDFLSKKVRWTFEHDRSILSAPELFENIESPTLMQLLAQIIIGLYSEEVDKLCKGKTATEKMSTLEKKEEDDLWGAFSFGGIAKNKKEKNKGALEEEPPPPEPESEPVVNESSHAKKEDPWSGEWRKLEPELEPEPPKVEVDPYAGLSKLQARKLKIKLDKEAKLKEEEDAKRQKEEEEEAAKIMQQEEEEAEKIRLEEEAELKRIEEEEAASAVLQVTRRILSLMKDREAKKRMASTSEGNDIAGLGVT